VTERLAAVFLGPPGCGKTTVVDRLAAHSSGVRAVVAGRLLRREAERDAPHGQTIRESIEEGELVSSETAMNAVVRDLSAVEEHTLLFDGYPRTLEQLSYFLRIVEHLGSHAVCVVVLEVSCETADRRLTERNRDDDRLQTIRERREQYAEQTRPLIEELRERYPDHFYVVSAEPPVDSVVHDVAVILAKEGAGIADVSEDGQ
jgi:adenylate kinase